MVFTILRYLDTNNMTNVFPSSNLDSVFNNWHDQYSNSEPDSDSQSELSSNSGLNDDSDSEFDTI